MHIMSDIDRLAELARTRGASSISQLLEDVPHICLLADDDRRYVDVNQAATKALQLTRNEIIGHRIDDFFAIASDIPVSEAWHEFVSASDQFGTCELLSTGARFQYRARINVLPGRHVSLLRPLNQPPGRNIER
jgi:PAS domain-containing protein